MLELFWSVYAISAGAALGLIGVALGLIIVASRTRGKESPQSGHGLLTPLPWRRP